jgi:prepilin-type processing-associated H-X9-DG protein
MYGGSFNYMNYFTDSTVTGFAAWSVQAVNNELYVTFANPFAKGSYGGVVDEFDTDGNLLRQFAANAPAEGPLQNPWGITQAPANFGEYSNDLLIGNVAGAGNINVFDPSTGAYLGQLEQPDGTPIAITGLWDLEFGDGPPHGGKTNQLFFDAGPNAPGVSGYGLFGVIRAAGDGGNPVREVAAPSQPVQQTLTRQQPQVVVQPVLADRQFAGAAAAQSAQLPQALVSIGALPASDLGEEAGSQVWISPNGASWGWDLGASTPTGQVDPRWVLDHGRSHVLGWSTATTFRN